MSVTDFVKKVGYKTIIPNLTQAKKILDDIPTGDYFEKKYDMAEGKDAGLKVYTNNFISFANKEKSDDNILDKLGKIGKLLAESLLTTTTTHKLNDFKDVYYSAKQESEKFRSNLFSALNSKGSDEQAGATILDEDEAKRIFTLFQKDEMDTALNELSIKLYDGNDKKAVKSRKTFIKTIKGYFKNISKNAKIINKILSKRGEFQDALKEELDAMPATEIIDTAQTTLEHECGIIGMKLDKVYVEAKDRMGQYFQKWATAFLVFKVTSFLAPLCPSVLLSIATIAGPAAILFEILAITSMPGPALKKYVKKYKGDCNKIKQASAQMFKSMREVNKFILETAKKGEESSAGPSVLNDNCKSLIRDFVTKFKAIWNNYAEDVNRRYDYFENMRYTGQKERENEGLRQKIANYDAILATIDADVKNYDAKTYNDLRDSTKKRLSRIFNQKSIDAARRNNYSVEYIKTNLDYQKKQEASKIEENEGTIKFWKDKLTGRSKGKKSSMGKFKDGFAKTLANLSYVE